MMKQQMRPGLQMFIDQKRAELEKRLEKLMHEISAFEDWAEKQGCPATSMD
jgi:hypothetical protein